MGKITIVKVGSTLPALLSRKGDFEDWVLDRLQLVPGEGQVVDVQAGEALPALDQIAGIVVTGSHAMVTEHHPWSERTAGWLAQAVEKRFPVLGICYGHQLLAYALGGEVGDNPCGHEYGTVEVTLECCAYEDALLGGFSASIRVQACHAQTVLRLPPGARRLAFSQRDQCQAFMVGGCAWGVQFHPEFDAEVVRAYIQEDEKILRREGQDPAALTAGCADTGYGEQILKRFAALTGIEPRQ